MEIGLILETTGNASTVSTTTGRALVGGETDSAVKNRRLETRQTDETVAADV
jgi:hypothetical protein